MNVERNEVHNDQAAGESAQRTRDEKRRCGRMTRAKRQGDQDAISTQITTYEDSAQRNDTVCDMPQMNVGQGCGSRVETT
jgi:hypothetical protein